MSRPIYEGTGPFVVANVSMGFLKLVPETVEVVGSGTLVRIGKLPGIVTARHVWKSVAALPIVGVYLYPTRRREIQSLKVAVNLLEAVCCGSDATEDARGPDLAFIKLPAATVAAIEQHSFFLNLEKSQSTFFKPPEKCSFVDAVTGLVDEWPAKETMHGDHKTVLRNGLLNLGFASPIEDGRCGFDRLEFSPEPEQGFELPMSYGGMSGGGCFRLHRDENGEHSYHLLGVAFYETFKEGKADKILCHGPLSIYEKLATAAADKWLTDIEGLTGKGA